MKQITIVLIAAGVFAGAACAWPGRPSAEPPKPGQSAGPPPAWIKSATKSVWLAYGSYCWRTACVDYLPPQARPDVPRLTIARGGVARVHLAFVPNSIAVRKFPEGAAVRLKPARLVSWHPSGGVTTVEVKAPGGHASFVVRLQVR